MIVSPRSHLFGQLALVLFASLCLLKVNGQRGKGGRPYPNAPTRFPKRKKNQTSTTALDQPFDQPFDAANNALITIELLFDDYPSDIRWSLTDVSTSLQIASGANYDDVLYRKQKVRRGIAVAKGSKYEFSVYDSYGDGIHNGYCAIFYGNRTDNTDELLILIDTFKSAQSSARFDAGLPLTPAPTTAAPTRSPAPTHEPTSCTPGGDYYHVRVDPYRKEPVYKNTSYAFGPIRNKYCTSHTTYLNCTNEFREDCQWVFLPSSRSKGMCRIDPIAKCLQMKKCVCNTEDFHGGRGDYAGGIIFHVPLSITARDISKYANSSSYREQYWVPQNNNITKHPHDTKFFISKVDFTSRQFTYRFITKAPMYWDINTNTTIAFKLHYLYTDLPLVGNILRGLGIQVSIDTSSTNHVITINRKAYVLTQPLKKWTCTSVVITPTNLYVAGNTIARVLSQEVPQLKNSRNLILGNFPGELFDFRVYAGTLTWTQIREVGARCTNPNDPAALKTTRAIDLYYAKNGCDSRINLYVTEPTSGKQTYGSGPFATLWVSPELNRFTNDGIYYDVSEDKLDTEYFFQHKKLQTYLWEKYYFESDMIAFPIEPYRYIKIPDEVPSYAASIWNNPCRFMHQNNNLWDFPLYKKDYVPKWVPSSPGEVFDLRDMFYKGGGTGYQYVAHETFHEFAQSLFLAHGQGIGWLLSESGASYGPASTFPGTDVLYAALPLAISYPFGYEMDASTVDANAHFMSEELSFSEGIRVGHIYNSWFLWWFLREHAKMPGIQGLLNSNERYSTGHIGILSIVRLFVEAEGMDLGDVWGIFLAHYRTWDFEMGPEFAAAEAKDFKNIMAYTKPPLPSTTTLENRKTTVNINPTLGTSNAWVYGPWALRPGPFGWNCLTMASVNPNRFVTINIAWDDGMGFQANTNPPTLPAQQIGCDDDIRFYNSMVVVHNLSSGQRRYWKLKGKTPKSLVIATGANGPVNIYILMVPTPPTDYASARHRASYTLMYPIPIYNYKYNVVVSSTIPSGTVLAAAEVMNKDGIINFSKAKDGFWLSKCTCVDDPKSGFCIQPRFNTNPAAMDSTPAPGMPVPVAPVTMQPTHTEFDYFDIPATRRPTNLLVTNEPQSQTRVTKFPTKAQRKPTKNLSPAKGAAKKPTRNIRSTERPAESPKRRPLSISNVFSQLTRGK